MYADLTGALRRKFFSWSESPLRDLHSLAYSLRPSMVKTDKSRFLERTFAFDLFPPHFSRMRLWCTRFGNLGVFAKFLTLSLDFDGSSVVTTLATIFLDQLHMFDGDRTVDSLEHIVDGKGGRRPLSVLPFQRRFVIVSGPLRR